MISLKFVGAQQLQPQAPIIKAPFQVFGKHESHYGSRSHRSSEKSKVKEAKPWMSLAMALSDILVDWIMQV